MSWVEHSHAARELASILTFELSVLDELAHADDRDGGQRDADPDSPAGSTPVHFPTLGTGCLVTTAPSGTLRPPRRRTA